MTASTLYEAVEPQILWRHLLTSIFDEIMGDGTQTEVHLFDGKIMFESSLYDFRQSNWLVLSSKPSHTTKRSKRYIFQLFLELSSI